MDGEARLELLVDGMRGFEARTGDCLIESRSISGDRGPWESTVCCVSVLERRPL